MQATASVTNTYEKGDATILFPTPAYSATPPTDKLKPSTVTLHYPTGNPKDFSPEGEGNDYWKWELRIPIRLLVLFCRYGNLKIEILISRKWFKDRYARHLSIPIGRNVPNSSRGGT